MDVEKKDHYMITNYHIWHHTYPRIHNISLDNIPGKCRKIIVQPSPALATPQISRSGTWPFCNLASKNEGNMSIMSAMNGKPWEFEVSHSFSHSFSHGFPWSHGFPHGFLMAFPNFLGLQLAPAPPAHGPRRCLPESASYFWGHPHGFTCQPWSIFSSLGQGGRWWHDELIWAFKKAYGAYMVHIYIYIHSIYIYICMHMPWSLILIIIYSLLA